MPPAHPPLRAPRSLITPHGGMWRWIGQMLGTACTGAGHAATARYRAFITYPASIRYGREPGLVLLILLIGIAYSGGCGVVGTRVGGGWWVCSEPGLVLLILLIGIAYPARARGAAA